MITPGKTTIILCMTQKLSYLVKRCEERFMDEPSACLYSTYLNGANLWVLPNDYIVRTGQEPENKLTKDEVSKVYIATMYPIWH